MQRLPVVVTGDLMDILVLLYLTFSRFVRPYYHGNPALSPYGRHLLLSTGRLSNLVVATGSASSPWPGVSAEIWGDHCCLYLRNAWHALGIYPVRSR